MIIDKNRAWSEKYRPKKIEDIAIPSKIKNAFMSMIETGNVPNLLLYGKPGCGKTTSALAIANEMNMEVLFINASIEGKIDTIRTKILDFVSSNPISGNAKRKMIIFDEVDGSSTSQSFQPALRAMMEKYSDVVYVFTANYINRVIEPLRSRCAAIKFDFDENERLEVEASFFRSLSKILANENIRVENNKVVANAIHTYYPDFRRLLNDIQRYVGENNNTLDLGFLNVLSKNSHDIEKIAAMLKEKNFSELRQYVANMGMIDDEHYTLLYKELATKKYMQPQSIPRAVIIISEYMYRNAFVADKEVNFVACLTTLMAECIFV